MLSRIVFGLAATVVLTTAFSAAAQEGAEHVLAPASAFQGKIVSFSTKPANPVMADRVRAASFAVQQVFEPLGSETEPRQYEWDERAYVGDEGRLSKRQVAAVKALIESLLVDPWHVASDDEKKALADALAISEEELESKTVPFKARFLAKLGIETQRRLGAQNLLSRVSGTRRALLVLERCADDEELEEEARQGAAKLERIVAEVPRLEDSETFLLPEEKSTGRTIETARYFARVVQLARSVLPEDQDFFAFLQRSLELEENGEALVALAEEYQVRGDNDKALEFWKRARDANAFSVVEQANLVLGTFDYRSESYRELSKIVAESADSEFDVDEALFRERVSELIAENIAEIENAPRIRIGGEGSGAMGLRVVVDVFSRKVRALKTTFYQIDLASYIARTRDESFYRSTDKSFANLVVEGLQESFEKGTPISSFATEVRSSVDTVSLEEGRESFLTQSSLVFTLDKPGAYLVRVADADAPDDDEKNAAYALAFASRYAFAYQNGRLLVDDFQSGAPYANRELDLLLASYGRPAETTVVKTDDAGCVKPTIKGGRIDRIVAFVQEDDPEEFDRSVSFFDSFENPYPDKRATDELELPTFSLQLILATSRPVYAPGDEVEFVGQLARASTSPSNMGGCWRVKVYPKNRSSVADEERQRAMGRQKASPREIASFDVEVDKAGGFAGTFKIPEDAEPGEYWFAYGKEDNRFFERAKTTLYVSTFVDEVVGESSSSEPSETSAPDGKTSPEPLIALEFEKPNYSLSADGVANVVVRSSIPDATVSIEKVRQRVATFEGASPVERDVKIVELRDGVGNYVCDLKDADAPFFTLIADVVRDNKAQTAYYLVGVQKKSAVRDAILTAPEKVRPGENVVLRAEFPPLEKGVRFSEGRASLVLYDAKLDLTPCDDFSSFVKDVQLENRLLERRKYPPVGFLNPLPPPKLLGGGSIPDASLPRSYPYPCFYERYVDTALPPPWLNNPYLFAYRRIRPPKSEYILDEVPRIPASASREYVLKERVIDAPVDSLSFEFDAPQTPGTYRIVFRAFDSQNGRATFVKKDLIVE